MALTKADIAKNIQSKLNFTRNKSFGCVETLLETIKKYLESGQDVLVSGFGKFCVNGKRQRRGRNPATGDAMMLRERKVVTFKCSGKLRKIINGK
jgi:integration host factor subunit alpha